MKRKMKKIDNQTLVNALAEFERNGGVIQQLPAQKYYTRQMVSEERYNSYEPLHIFSALTS